MVPYEYSGVHLQRVLSFISVYVGATMKQTMEILADLNRLEKNDVSYAGYHRCVIIEGKCVLVVCS